MTNQQILTKAIQKAIDGGWQPFDIDKEGNIYLGRLERVIFNKDFAKALWGEEYLHDLRKVELAKPDWQYHLQRMVIAEDPIKYLGENI